MQALNLRSGFTVGADPEVFIVDGNGEFVCADGLIPGTKDKPYPVKNGAVQVDGMAGEFNIDPASTFEEFNSNIVSVMTQLKDMLPAGYDLRVVSSAEFSKEVWKKAPNRAKELGCMPDVNAWTCGLNPTPRRPTETFCAAGGHIHLGWPDPKPVDDIEHVLACHDIVRQFDWYLGGWSVEADPAGNARRALYGKAGACRYKPYGVEYRTLSNFWIETEELRLATWNRVCAAVDSMTTSFWPEAAGINYNKRLIKYIETSIKDQKLLAMFELPLKVV